MAQPALNRARRCGGQGIAASPGVRLRARPRGGLIGDEKASFVKDNAAQAERCRRPRCDRRFEYRTAAPLRPVCVAASDNRGVSRRRSSTSCSRGLRTEARRRRGDRSTGLFLTQPTCRRSPDAVQTGTRAPPRCSSCYLVDSPATSATRFTRATNQVGAPVQIDGGIGISWSRCGVRFAAQLDRGTNGSRTAIVPWRRNARSSSPPRNQGGRRKGGGLRLSRGAWHPTSRSYRAARQHGQDARRAHNLNLAHWIRTSHAPGRGGRAVSSRPRTRCRAARSRADAYDGASPRREEWGRVVREGQGSRSYGRMNDAHLAQTGNGGG